MPAREDIVSLSSHESIPGVTFRRLRGKRDYPTVADIVNRSWKADLFNGVNTAEDIARDLDIPQGFSVAKDVYMVELEGKQVGFGRVYWADRLRGVRSYTHMACLVPEARRQGIREAMLRMNEARIRTMASRHKSRCTKFFETEANSKRNDWNRTVLRNDYVPYRHIFEMVRPNLDKIPAVELPDGLEVRPVVPRDHRTIWRAAREAFKDEPGFRSQTWSDEGLRWFSGSRWWTPGMWQIAWDGNQVAGGVINMIDEEENRAFKRNWGYTVIIFTRTPWRRKGLAGALIAQSLEVHKSKGMKEAALAVDTENPTGALRLYRRMGYRAHSQYTFYRKPVP